MSEGLDPEELARRYLDLWQEQVAQTMGDPALAEAIGQVYSAFSKGYASLLSLLAGAAQAAATEAKDFPDGIDAPSRPPSPGAAAPGAASGRPDRDLDELRVRLASLEERLRRLEGPPAPEGGGAGTRSRRRRG